MKRILPLNGKDWQFTWTNENAGPESIKKASWKPASVPGNTHLDMWNAGEIGDPLYGTNALKCEWMETKAWWYRRRFSLPLSADSGRIELICDGLDLDATLWLNGQLLGKHHNALIPCRWNLAPFLRKGENELLVRLESGVSRGRKGKPLPGCSFGTYERQYLRKCQCCFGWDWAPRLVNCGIWRPVSLEIFDRACLRNVCYRTRLEPGAARVEVSATVENFGKDNIQGLLKIGLERNGKKHPATVRADLKPGLNEVKTELRIPRPDLWWPRPLGNPALYSAAAVLKSEGKVLDERRENYGLREVKIDESALSPEEGKQFTFIINGVPVYAKGGNWVPCDAVLPRINRKLYEKNLDMAEELNTNMLRVWGGGIYESPDFYRLCDERGIMVWQEFIFSCSCYPGFNPAFCREVRREAEIAVTMLRNHPSIVTWCGNNEIDGIMWGHGYGTNFPGHNIFHEILPDVCRQLDPTRPYRPSSPYGGRRPGDPLEGDRHGLFVSADASYLDPAYYEEEDSRPKFVAEVYAFSPSSTDSLRQFLPQSEMRRDSPGWNFHNRSGHSSREFDQTLATYIGPQDRDLETYIWHMQILHAEQLRHYLEHCHRRKFLTSGCLYWMVNDTWGISEGGLTTYDWYFRRKVPHYAVRKVQAEILATVRRTTKGTVEIWLTSDLPHNVPATFTWKHVNMQGREFSGGKLSVVIAANSSTPVVSFPFREIRDDRREAIFMKLETGNRPAYDRVHFFQPISRLLLPVASVKIEEKKELRGNRARVLVLSDKLARYVELDLGDPAVRFSDNCFDLIPGERKEILIENIKPGTLKRLRLRWFNEKEETLLLNKIRMDMQPAVVRQGENAVVALVAEDMPSKARTVNLTLQAGEGIQAQKPKTIWNLKPGNEIQEFPLEVAMDAVCGKHKVSLQVTSKPRLKGKFSENIEVLPLVEGYVIPNTHGMAFSIRRLDPVEEPVKHKSVAAMLARKDKPRKTFNALLDIVLASPGLPVQRKTLTVKSWGPGQERMLRLETNCNREGTVVRAAVRTGKTTLAEFGHCVGPHAPVKNRELTCAQVQRSVRIGAHKTPVWDRAEWLCLSSRQYLREVHNWRGPDDLSAAVLAGWDADYFYITIQVRDDFHCQPFIGNNLWQGDAVEIGISPEHGSREYSEMAMGLTKFGPELNIRRLSGRIKIPQVKRINYRLGIYREPENGNLTYELSLPWQLILMTKPAAGMVLGFAMTVADNDGSGRRGWMEWGGGIADDKDPSRYCPLPLLRAKQ